MPAATAALKAVARRAWYWGKRLDLGWLDLGDRRGAALLRYHSVSDPADAVRYVEPGIAVAPRAFDRQMALLAARYRPLSMDALLEALAGGRRPPANAVVVTFDDGYRDNYEHAFPILRRHGVPAMFYLATGCIDTGRPLWTSEVRHLVRQAGPGAVALSTVGGRWDVSTPAARQAAIRAIKRRLAPLPRADREAALDELRRQVDADPGALKDTMMTWAQVREMRRHGLDFGAHTVTHPLLPGIPPAEAAAEIRESIAELAGALGEPVRHFSYPNPGGGVHASPEVAAAVRQAGCLTAVTSQQGYVDVGDDLYALARVAVSPHPWALPFELERDAVRRPRAAEREVR